MKCLSCGRTLQAGGSSQPMGVTEIEAMFAEVLGWTESKEGWTCAECDSDEHSKSEDAEGG